MNTFHIQDELVTTHNQDITLRINYPQKLLISRGLTNLEGNGRSRLEVDLLFFAQDDYVTDSRYHTETYRKIEPFPLLCNLRKYRLELTHLFHIAGQDDRAGFEAPLRAGACRAPPSHSNR